LRLHDFSGQTAQWSDWVFSFKRSIRAASKEVYDLMDEVEKMTADVDEDSLEDLHVDANVEKLSGELYDVLCQVCLGEALSVIRVVDDCRGFLAWQKLYRKYNPRTMARAIRLMGEVTSPPKVRDLSEVEGALNKWTEKVKQLSREFGEDIREGMKIAIVTSMMPPEIQDYVYTNIKEGAKAEAMIEKIKSVVGNKVAMMGVKPVPMEVGEVVPDGAWSESWEEEVGAVGMHVQCRQCWGYGHLQRECPTKGKGKGKGFEKGKPVQGQMAKGLGKAGKGPGYSDGARKGSGKGYQGTCWRCGTVGHKAAECSARMANAVHEELDDSVQIEVGGIWPVGAVDVDGGWSCVAGTRRLAKETTGHSPCPGPKVQKHNRFQALCQEEEEEEDELMIGSVGVTGRPERQVGEKPDAAVRKHTRTSSIKFHVTNVKQPLVSAVKVVEAGNKIVMSAEGSYVENVVTGERMKIRPENGTFVFDVTYQNGEEGTMTLDSGAGVNVWPKELLQSVPVGPKEPGLRMKAANGTDIENLGAKIVLFRGLEAGFQRQA
jgi:hypothetical protein